MRGWVQDDRGPQRDMAPLGSGCTRTSAARAARRSLLAFAVIATAAACLIPRFDAQAVDSKEVLASLSKTPVTMFDWGLERLDQDVKTIAYYLTGRGSDREPPIAGTLYSWHRGQIEIYMSLHERYENRTADRCREIFGHAIDALTNGSPGGIDKASWYLETLFVPKGRPWTRPVSDVGDKLISVVRFEVILRAAGPDEMAGDNLRVRCSGPMNARGEAIEAIRTGRGS